MACLHSIVEIGTARLRRQFLILVAALGITVLGCELDLPGTLPSTPGDPPGQPGPDPEPEPEPEADPQPSSKLSRTPYLQMLGSNSVTIVFRTVEAVEAQVDYGTTRNYGSTASGASTPPTRSSR